MYFPVADLEVHPLLPPAVAFFISLFTSMGGISGAFLLLPFLVSIFGFTSPAVSATNQLFNVVAIPGGVYRYVIERRMVWSLAWLIILGTLPGVFIGAYIRIQYLPDPARFKLFVGLILFFIGGRLLQNARQGEERPLPDQITAVRVTHFNLTQIAYQFQGQTYRASSPALLSLSLIVGVIGGIYGIGGGAIIAPILIAFFHLPVYTIAGAALLATLVTSVAGVLFYQFLSLFYPHLSVAPDYALGFLFGLGGLAGMYCGARLQKYAPARFIKWTLIVCIMLTAVRYLFQALPF